jgi:prevent-host-death family protein
MTITTLTSREFNQDRGRAKRAASTGPVFVTDRGRPSLVLVSYEEWLRLSGRATSIAEALAATGDAADIDFEIETDRTIAAAADLD